MYTKSNHNDNPTKDEKNDLTTIFLEAIFTNYTLTEEKIQPTKNLVDAIFLEKFKHLANTMEACYLFNNYRDFLDVF